MEIRVQFLVQGRHGKGTIQKPAQPQSIAKQQMIEGSVDGLEEGRAIPLALSIGDLRTDSIEPLVHPAIVLRHGSEVFQREHGFPPQ
jgi:hypothetical protein